MWAENPRQAWAIPHPCLKACKAKRRVNMSLLIHVEARTRPYVGLCYVTCADLEGVGVVLNTPPPATNIIPRNAFTQPLPKHFLI